MIPESLKWALLEAADRVYEDGSWSSNFSLAIQKLDTASHFQERKSAAAHIQKLLLLVETLIPDSIWSLFERFMQTWLQSDYFIHPSSVADIGAQIGSGTKIWHFSHIMAGAKIGKQCNLGQNVLVSNDVVLGNNVKVQNNVSLYTGVVCHDDVFLGPSVVLTNVINPRSAIVRKDAYQSTEIGKGASIGANATLICGNNIGAFAFVGAGTVVTKEVPAYAMVIGNPAKQTAWMGAAGYKLVEMDNDIFQCPVTGEKYEILGSSLQKL